MPKKTKNCKYGSYPNGRCKPKPKSRVGTRTAKEIRHHKLRKREPYLSDVSGVGIGITKKLEKDVYDFIKANKGVAPREIQYMFGESKAQEALKTLEKEDKIYYREENMTYYIGPKPRKEKIFNGKKVIK